MTKDESKMLKESPVDYILSGVYDHWKTVKLEMEGVPINVLERFHENNRNLTFGGNPAKARRVTSRDAARDAHTFRIRT